MSVTILVKEFSAPQLKSCTSAPYLVRMKLSPSAWGLPSVLALGVACALPPSAAQAAAPKAGVVAGSGKTQGGVFTAGPDGAEYQLPSQARLSLAPGSAVHLFPLPQQLQLAPGSKTTTYSLLLVSGRVDVTVPSKPKSAVLCNIGKISVVVAAGQATLLTRGDEATVASASGEVRTLADKRWQTLTPGTLARFGGRGKGLPEPAAPAPEIAPGQRLWFSPGEPVAISDISVNQVEVAEHYELRLRSADGSVQQLRAVRGGTRQQQAFAPVMPGAYELAARSIDAEGIAGPWSKAEALRVVGVTLPPGAYAAGGDIFVGRGQDVHFSNTEGLEMTYEGAGRYVPASEAVSLYRGETTVVSFRVKGSVFPTSARLRPRSLYAQVELSPSRAVWPRDPIKVEVEVRTRDGAGVPAWLEPKTDVQLGIDSIPVEFTREGNRWVATVPPTDKPGPWVLRVQVADQFGSLLGHNFLEIARAAPSPPKPTASTRVASK